jgi:hypothetical protein
MSDGEDCFICLKRHGGSRAPGGPIYEDAYLFIGHAAVSDDGIQPYLGHYTILGDHHKYGLRLTVS